MNKIVLFLLLLCGVQAFSQNGSVSGIVIDKKNQQPIFGATVRLENSQFGCISNEKGEFLI
ncbi:MAG: carboxypeptidase-like regulatory domain-containing protein, partial [Bacteroidota bacterium]